MQTYIVEQTLLHISVFTLDVGLMRKHKKRAYVHLCVCARVCLCTRAHVGGTGYFIIDLSMSCM